MSRDGNGSPKNKEKLSPEEKRLNKAINEHEIFNLPKEERLADTRLFADITDLLMKRFGEKFVAQSVRTDDNYESETSEIDGLAFYRVFRYCVKSFDITLGIPFIAFFRKMYKREKSKNIEMDIKEGKMRLSQEDRRIIGKVSKYEDEMELRPEDLGECDFEKIAQSLNITVDKIKSALAHNFKREYKSLNEKIDYEDENTELIDLRKGFPGAEEEFFSSNNYVEMIVNIVKVLSEGNWKKTTRVFFTNEILYKLKVEPETSDNELPLALERCEETLWEKVFDEGYIVFVYITPPVPDTVRKLYFQKLEKIPLKKTVAEYLNVTKSRVSQIGKDAQKVIPILQKMLISLGYADFLSSSGEE